MKEQKRVPKLRFEEFSGEWEKKYLEDIGEVVNGLTYSPSDIHDNGILVLRSSNIQSSRLIFEDNVFVKVDDFNPVRENDILICVRNGSRGLIGKNALVTKETEGLAFGAFMSVFRSELNLFNFQLFATKRYFKTIHENLGATINSINNNELRKFDFYYPTHQEQQKIASFLSSVDKKISQLQQKKSLLEQYKKGAMQQLFPSAGSGQVPQLRFKKKDGSSYPDWEEKRLGEIAKINMGQSPSSKSYNSIGVGVYLIQGNADIKERKTNPRNWTTEPTKVCEIGDLILTVRAPVGAIAKSIHHACIGRGVCSIKNKLNSNIEFLYQFLLDYEAKWSRWEQGSTFTAVSGKDIKDIKIPFPSKEEQTKIAQFLSAIDKKIAVVQTQIEHTQQFKKGLLQQLFV